MLLVSGNVWAIVCNSETCTTTLERIEPINGDLWIKLAGGVSTNTCEATNGVLLLKSESNASYKDLVALFLMAYTTESKVRVRMLSDSEGKCEIKYAYVDKTL